MASKPKGIIAQQDPELPDGYNRRKISFLQNLAPRGVLDPNDVDEMERRFARYQQLCSEYDMKPSNQSCYYAIGISKDQVYHWTTDKKNNNLRRSEFVEKIKAWCAMYREEMMLDGRINPVTGIFWQKNYDGFRDQQEVVLTPNNPLGDDRSPEELKRKYLEATYNLSDDGNDDQT